MNDSKSMFLFIVKYSNAELYSYNVRLKKQHAQNLYLLMVRLKSSIQKFYCHYHDLVYRNRISVIIDYGYVQLAALPGLLLIHSLSPYICNQRNMTGAISGTRTAYPFGIHGFASGFSGARVARSLVLCVVFFFLSSFIAWVSM